MKPRLVHILRTLHLGGAEVQILSLLPHLLDDFEVSVVCLHDRGTLAPDLERLGVPVSAIRFKNRWSPIPMWRLRNYLKKRKVDIVQTHLYGPSISAIAAARLAGVPVRISTVHDMDHWRLKRRLQTDRALMRWRDAVFCVSEPVRQVYIEKTGCPPDMVRVMPNGLDLSGFQATRSPQQVRTEFGIPDGNLVVGMVANLVPIKNHRGFLEVAARIRSHRKDVSFLLVGDGELRQGLEERAAELDLRDSVVFAGARRDVADLLGAMDCFLLTSFREAFSIAVLESMTMGIPVVATNQGGVGDIIRSSEEGLLVDPTDHEAMAAAVSRIMSDRELRETLIRNGRTRARDFDMDRVARNTVSVYRELLAAKSSKRTAARAASSG